MEKDLHKILKALLRKIISYSRILWVQNKILFWVHVYISKGHSQDTALKGAYSPTRCLVDVQWIRPFGVRFGDM